MHGFQFSRYSSYMVQLGLWLVIGLVGWFGVRFLLQAITMNQNQLQEYVVLGEHRQKQMGEIPRLEEQFTFINQSQDTLSIVLTREELVGFIESVESLAEVNGVVIEMTSRDNTLLESKTTKGAGAVVKDESKGAKSEGDETPVATKKAPVKKETGILADLPLKKSISLTITVTGTYPAIVEFLHQVETMPYALDVISIRIEEHEEEARSSSPENGVSPFIEGISIEEALPPIKKSALLDAHFETLVYTKE